jgi:hypothetical protein
MPYNLILAEGMIVYNLSGIIPGLMGRDIYDQPP